MSLQLTQPDPTDASPSSPRDEMRSATTETAQWLMLDSWRERLLGSDAPDWFNLHDEPRAEPVKTGMGRTVWRVRLANGAVFAKAFDAAGGAASIRRWFGRSPAEREFRTAMAADRRGVGLVRFVAAGSERRLGAASVLISEERPAAITLVEAWRRFVGVLPAGPRRAAVAGLTEPVARLYAAAHGVGYFDRDGHPENVLVFPDSDSKLRAVFVDLHAVRLRLGPVTEADAAVSLGQLEHVFKRLATRGERLRFLRRYLELRRTFEAAPGVEERRLIATVQKAVQSQAQRLAGQRDRRLRRDGKYFGAITVGGGWRAAVTLELERRHLFPEPWIPDRSRADWQAVLQRLQHEPQGGDENTDDADGGGVALKVQRARSLRERVSWTVSGSPARKAFLRCHRLRHRDVAAPLVLGFAERRRGGLVEACALVLPVQE